jgi:hypothetical protein
MAHHDHRSAPMGPRVLIKGTWYNSLQCGADAANKSQTPNLKRDILFNMGADMIPSLGGSNGDQHRKARISSRAQRRNVTRAATARKDDHPPITGAKCGSACRIDDGLLCWSLYARSCAYAGTSRRRARGEGWHWAISARKLQRTSPSSADSELDCICRTRTWRNIARKGQGNQRSHGPSARSRPSWQQSCLRASPRGGSTHYRSLAGKGSDNQTVAKGQQGRFECTQGCPLLLR